MKYSSLAVIGAIKAFNSVFSGVDDPAASDPAVRSPAIRMSKNKNRHSRCKIKTITPVLPPYEDIPEEGLACGNVFGVTPKRHFTKRSAFLNLPPEIRVQIYQEYFRGSRVWLVRRHSAGKLILLDRDSTKNRRLPLLLACRSTYLEGIDVLYSTTVFTLNEPGTIEHLPMVMPKRYDCGYDSIRMISTMCLVSPEGIADFEKACGLFALIPSLHSLRVEVGPVGRELGRRIDLGMRISWAELVSELENCIRTALCQLQHVKSICVWFQWGNVTSVPCTITMPKSSTVHRRYGDAKAWYNIDEDHNGQVLTTGVTKCHCCIAET